MKEGQEVRRVAQFDWRVIEPSCNVTFEAAGLTFTPLPVSILFNTTLDVNPIHFMKVFYAERPKGCREHSR